MNDSVIKQPCSHRLLCKYSLLPLLVWSALVAASLLYSLSDIEATLFALTPLQGSGLSALTEPVAMSLRAAYLHSVVAHSVAWLLISVLMIAAIRQLLGNQSALCQSQNSLLALNAELEATVKARTRQFLASMHTLKDISSHAPGIVYQYLLRPDGSNAIPYANDHFFEIFGLYPEAVRNDAACLYEAIHPDDRADFIASTRFSARDLTPWQHEFRIRDAAGRERWLLGDTVPERQENGLTVWNGFITDITQRKLAEAEMKRHKIIIDAAQDGFWMVDANGYLKEVNQAYAQMTGYSRDELLRMHISELETPEQSADIKAHIDQLFSAGHDVFETRHRHKDGHDIDVEMSATYLFDTQTFFVFCRDISKRKQIEDALRKSEDRFRHLADYDALTKLPNRRLLVDRLESAMAASRRSGCYGALMFLDLDNFKPLNDLHGHDAGDQLLLEVAKRPKSCIREVDTVARLGGDEFVVVLSELDKDVHQSNTQARQVAEKIRTTLSQPYALQSGENKVEHLCSASIGVALFFNHENTHEEIFKRADSAMYQAKKSGRNQACFYTG